jgi:hypothetical protein
LQHKPTASQNGPLTVWYAQYLKTSQIMLTTYTVAYARRAEKASRLFCPGFARAVPELTREIFRAAHAWPHFNMESERFNLQRAEYFPRPTNYFKNAICLAHKAPPHFPLFSYLQPYGRGPTLNIKPTPYARTTASLFVRSELCGIMYPLQRAESLSSCGVGPPCQV